MDLDQSLGIPPLSYLAELPITEKRALIVEAIRDHQVLVITGETGSGKTTQIPKMCLEAGRGTRGWIGCTQPRRIAAITVAHRVAAELGTAGRGLVGYKIRFQDSLSRRTRIKFMTDGILLAEAQHDRMFKAYDTIIVDEAHERSLNIDFLLGLLRRILPRRPELKVIITSATIEPEKFSQAFHGAPILEVSGRTYPVEVWYRPLDAADGDEGEATLVDQAVAAVDFLKGAGERGDILVFMPTESDIRETVQRLEERGYPHTRVFPLFGRMAATDQERIFEPHAGEKIVVATNVAETSVTIPGIRTVIDTGLARLPQYNARSRTQLLPVVPISQASADQRKGRCGRVAAGLCLRLYPQEDYLARPRHTPAAIQRANLAEVILRMLALKLGDIQEFPFLDPPSPAAIKDGFAVLRELGAVDGHRHLTALGATMAKLPLDPRLARILLQARKEGSLREALVIAAALSIQDPRERPTDQEAHADQIHARFRVPHSDFATLLRIWEAYQRHRQAGSSQTQLRRFCKDHFLSYRRMREWAEIHEQIQEIVNEGGRFHINAAPAAYDGIHRAIVSGYLSNVALRKERNLYLGTRGRQAVIHPGSGLFQKGGSWIVAAELVQTTRLYARTVATIEPEWVEELGSHLARRSYSEPHWEKRRGQVLAYERVTVYGLPVAERRKVNYGAVHPAEARAIFIRSALVDGELPGRYGFLTHNQALVQEIEAMEHRTRRCDLLATEETLFRFYDERLPAIADTRSLDRFLKTEGGDAVLRMSLEDLLQAAPEAQLLERFPETLRWGEAEIPLRYTFRPGDDDDGVTATIPVHLAPRLPATLFDWLVPGLLVEKVALLLKALPKSRRRRLVPLQVFANRIMERLRFQDGDFCERLSRAVEELAGMTVAPEQWAQDMLPPHLRMRFAIVTTDGSIVAAGRDFRSLLAGALGRHVDHIWEQARAYWEKEAIGCWNFGPLPDRIELGTDGLGIGRYAYPGIVNEGDSVAIRLFAAPEEALEASRGGLLALTRMALATEIQQLQGGWKFPRDMEKLLSFLGGWKEANARLHDYLVRELLGNEPCERPSREGLERSVENLRGRLGELAKPRYDRVLAVVAQRHKVHEELEHLRRRASGNAAARHILEGLRGELEELVPGDFLRRHADRCMAELPRYLGALRVRAQRAYASPEKDRLKAEHLGIHRERYAALKAALPVHPRPEQVRFLEDFRWMLEDYKVSLFAPEIKTRLPISSKRLEAKWQEWHRGEF
jgi:ATP-dependent helicase HrpA